MQTDIKAHDHDMDANATNYVAVLGPSEFNATTYVAESDASKRIRHANKRIRHARGAHAQSANAQKLNPALRKSRQERLIKKLTLCLVCGEPTFKDGKFNDTIKWREVAGYEIQACERHEKIGMTMTLSGHPRFHETA